MANPDTVTALLTIIHNNQAKLAILGAYPHEEFEQDFTRVESAKHLLQVSIQACLDLAHHIIADAGFRPPQDSYDAFVILNEESIVPTEFLPTLRRMVSFRNRIVHLYWDVDVGSLPEILTQRQQDLDIYPHYVLHYLDQSA